MGAVIFYLIFPQDLDLNGTYIAKNFAEFGAPSDIQFTVPGLLVVGLCLCAVSSVFVPFWFISLGEDIGWQGYLLPLLCKKMPVKLAVLLTGVLWGSGHAPLIYSGMNYGMDYATAPYGGIAMMILCCTTIGVWMSYATLKTNNCMYASVIHGSLNLIGEVPVFVSLSSQSTLLGPNPSGIIGMSLLLIGAIVLIFKMPDPQS
ncbi:MAG: CPBP family intramembrane glutamic endopeptidase [Acutalibacteraceae bacterium]|nr:CPBP family intramembrane glutamic endopeptidase [Acutalibacteraceae bacterium]